MPRKAHIEEPQSMQDHMDELQKHVQRMRLPEEHRDDLLSLHRLSYSSGSTDEIGHSDESQELHRRSDGAAEIRQTQSDPRAMFNNSMLEGNLEIIRSLGEGSSGEVALARVRPTGRVIARKTISTSPDPMIHRQLLRELNVNQTCRSPYIVEYYGAFFDPHDANITICMEYCEAGSMDAIYRRIKARGGRVGEKILVKLASSILHGLEYLRARRIIHRDVKPSNILVTRSGEIKLCDFGVAGELVNSVAGTFTGTSMYMAPERIMGHAYTISSDVWALGISILELAMNRFPFPPDSDAFMGPIDLMTFLLHAPLPTLQDEPENGIRWSRALRDFLARCLTRDGKQRASPRILLQHPIVKRGEAVPDADMARFVAHVWQWAAPYPTPS
ncbi:mitogen-activated protein kinase kinase [Malassezia vespertilionis]|nr:mitogen-activated protein kinase kinase [Malassezia vespertilionis]WFD06213.1 mitogen-activated protein kinase kinase [Malassezia vespertilionis]